MFRPEVDVFERYCGMLLSRLMLMAFAETLEVYRRSINILIIEMILYNCCRKCSAIIARQYSGNSTGLFWDVWVKQKKKPDFRVRPVMSSFLQQYQPG